MPTVTIEICKDCHFYMKNICQYKFGDNGEDFSFFINNGKGGCLLKKPINLRENITPSPEYELSTY